MNLPNAVAPERSRVSVANGSARRGSDSGAVSGSDAVPDPFSALLAEVFRKSDILSKLSAPCDQTADSESPEEAGPTTRRSHREASGEEESAPGSEGLCFAFPQGLSSRPDPVLTTSQPGEGTKAGVQETPSLQGRSAEGAGQAVPTPLDGLLSEVSSQAEDSALQSSASEGALRLVDVSPMRSLTMPSGGIPAVLQSAAATATGGTVEVGAEAASGPGEDRVDRPSSQAESPWESFAVEDFGGDQAKGTKGVEDPGTSEVAGEDDSGTSGADKEGAMLAETLMNETSELGGQELPSGSDFSVAVQMPESGANRELRGHSGASEQAMATVTPGWALDSTLDREVRPGISAPADPGRAERVERLAGLTEAAVVEFRRSQGGEYEVSIRPDDATEIRLSVSLGDRGPEVRAELRRGDAAAFAAQWPDLQARLSQQGIRLMPNAAGVGNPAGSGGGTHPGPGREQRRESVSNPFESRRVSPGTRDLTIRSAPRRFSGGQGWETWA